MQSPLSRGILKRGVTVVKKKARMTTGSQAVLSSEKRREERLWKV